MISSEKQNSGCLCRPVAGKHQKKLNVNIVLDFKEDICGFVYWAACLP